MSSAGVRGPRRLVLLALLIALVGARAPVAAAHGVDPSVRAVLDAVEPPVPGLVVQVADSVAPEVVVDNPTGTALVVLADTGEPFLRIGPGGVEANLASPSWYATNNPNGGPAPAGVDPSGAPRWARVSDKPSWGWFDHRLHPATVSGADGDAHRPWVVPFRYGDQAGEIRGHLERRQFAGSFTSRLVAGATPLPGVTVQLLDGSVPGLLLRNTGTEPVTVFGAEGEPFARIGPEGAEVNRHSATYVRSAQAQGRSLAEEVVVDPAATPDWATVSADPSYAWIDERGRFAGAELPPAAAAASTATVVVDWRVPLEQGGARVELRAVTAWVPASPDAAPAEAAGSRLELYVTGLLLAAAAVSALIVLRHHRRARSTGTAGRTSPNP